MTQTKLPFSDISIIQALHRSLCSSAQSTQCKLNRLSFIKLVFSEYKSLILRPRIQKALSFYFLSALSYGNKDIVAFLKKQNILNFFSEKQRLYFFKGALLADTHSEHEYIFELLKQSFPELLKHRKMALALLAQATTLKKTKKRALQLKVYL